MPPEDSSMPHGKNTDPLASGNEVNANLPTAPSGRCGKGDVSGCNPPITGDRQAAPKDDRSPADLQPSEEAKNQDKTSQKSRAESGTTAPRHV